MIEEASVNHGFDKRLDSYRSFFDFEWSKDFLERVTNSRFERPALALMQTWRSIGATHLLPWLAVDNIRSFADGFAANEAEHSIQDALLAIRKALPLELRDFNSTKRQAVVRAIDRIAARVIGGLRNEPIPELVDPQAVWGEFLTLTTFQLALWGSQRLCYGALYHSYESFLRDCIDVANGKPADRHLGTGDMIAELDRLFGNTIKDDFSSEPVKRARLARNALAHNGGRASDDLKASPAKLKIDDQGYLQIMAPDTRELYELLREKVEQILTEALKRYPQ